MAWLVAARAPPGALRAPILVVLLDAVAGVVVGRRRDLRRQERRRVDSAVLQQLV
jgi:hypothetical protein